MRRASAVAVGLACLVLAACTPPKGVSTVTSKLVLLPVPDDPSVAIRIAFSVGSEDDPPGKEGLAALTGALMAEGATTRMSYDQILAALYPMSTSYGVRTDVEQTTFSGRAHRDDASHFAGLLLDAVRRPAFLEADFERLRARAVDEIEKQLRYASDEELGKAVLETTIFAGTPYGHLPEGTVTSLSGLTLDDVREFYRIHFTRDRFRLGVGGAVGPALVATLEQGLQALPVGSPEVPPPPQVVPVEGRRVVIAAKPGPATAISFGFPIDVHRGAPDFYALWVANSWLGEHRNSSSRLYQVIREARGLNYGDYSYIEHFPEGGRRSMPPPNVPRRQQIFEVWIRPVPNQDAHFALRAAVRELDRLVRDGLTPEQFELTRTFLTKYGLHFAETTSARLGYALDDRFYGIGEPGHLARFRAEMGAMTLDRVNQAIRRHLHPENMVIAIVSERGDELAEALASEAPSPITYATPKPQEVLAEDKEIAAYRLGIAREAITVVPVDQIFQAAHTAEPLGGPAGG